MLLSDQLLESALSQFSVDRADCRTLDLYLFENGHEELVELPLTDNNALRNWIAQSGTYAPPTTSNKEICAKLRLLCIAEPSPTGFKLERDQLKALITQLGIPKTFPADFMAVRREEMTFVSPSFQANRMEISMTYSEATKTTTGVLRLNYAPGSPQGDVLSTLRKSMELCSHPLLLPAIACNAWYEIMANQYGAVHDQVRENVQYKTNLMPNYFISENQRYEDFDGIDQQGLHEQYEDIHSTIVEQHNYLSNGLSYFVQDFARTLQDGTRHMQRSAVRDVLKEELWEYIERLVSRTKVELNHRERLLAKLEIQIQVLYTLMQQRDSRTNLQIADETKRDSSAMKTLSLITLVFLPLTAVASVFSMGSFISVDASNGSRIKASSQFWIYWAVVIPLTASLLLAWILWINRKQLLKRGKKQSDEWPDYSGQSKDQ